MGTPGINAAKYKGEHSSFTYYFVPVMAILFGIFWMGHGCVGFFGPQVHTAYFETPACDESLLASGQENFAPVCSVVKATVSLHNEEFNTYRVTLTPAAGQKRLDAVAPLMSSLFFVKMSSDAQKEERPIFAQIFNEEGPDHKQVYVAAKVFDPATQKITKTSDVPVSKNGQAWADIRIAWIIIAGACVWIFLGRFMVFSK